MKWTTDHVPAFFDLLRKYAKDREKGITQSRVFLASDTSIHVSPNPDGPITICPNNHPSADTTTCNTLPPDATADKPKEDVCSSSDDLTDPVEPVAVVTRKTKEPPSVPVNPSIKFAFLLSDEEENELIEAITRPVPPPSAEDMEWTLGEDKIMGSSEDESKTVLPPHVENVWSRVDLPRALFEAPTNASEVQKNLIADKHSVSKPVQSKPAP